MATTHPVPTLKEVKERLSTFDAIGRRRNGNYIVRRGFFYSHGYTADTYVQHVLEAYPHANIVASGRVDKPFRGGADIAHSSHFYVEFNFATK
jgi:hypothetical protein